MFAVLKVSKEKISDKLIKSAEERVTTIRRELGRQVTFREVAGALKTAYQKVLDAHFVEDGLSFKEKELAIKLRKEKYSTTEWIYSRPSSSKGTGLSSRSS
jgi:lipoate-protein ligase A